VCIDALAHPPGMVVEIDATAFIYVEAEA